MSHWLTLFILNMSISSKVHIKNNINLYYINSWLIFTWEKSSSTTKNGITMKLKYTMFQISRLRAQFFTYIPTMTLLDKIGTPLFSQTTTSCRAFPRRRRGNMLFLLLEATRFGIQKIMV